MKNHLLLWCGMALLATACNKSPHFISDTNVRKEVQRDLNAKKELFADEQMFSIFDQDISLKEREALEFIYAYSPIGDIADYSGDFHLENVRAAFRIQEEMPWGKAIPEELFRHFVLPVRVNNENLDDSRIAFYNELKDRVKNLSLRDAVLEVNHWCHEKVIYTPSDARTSSPGASVRTAYGRCGEESVFTVAALRAVGIPARQVYTPRWAHTDDNHAWVEAWVDGEWYFFGACEPEPMLNLAWFNEPASRGMLMHSKVFGKYNGPEEQIVTTPCFTEINVTNIYAPTAPLTVFITDTGGKAVADAKVEFKLYNYAEFYSVVSRQSDGEGKASLIAGKGDMLVWASKDNRFGFQKVSFGKDENITLVLDKQTGDEIHIDLDVVPPVSGAKAPEVTGEQRAENDRRMHVEDSIRNSYVATFYTEEKARKLARSLNIDEEKTVKYLVGSRGNHSEIEAFLTNTPAEERQRAMDLLGAISDKDLRDTPKNILADHLTHTPKSESEYYTKYVLNPRVRNELLTPYRSFFTQQFSAEEASRFAEAPQELVKWVAEQIKIENDLNPQRIPVFPVGVWRSRVADTHSRNIFFVALARSLSIPSRIDPVTGKVQYIANSAWVNVDFETPEPTNTAYGKVEIVFPKGLRKTPKYEQQFTIARLHPNGTLQTLGFNSNEEIGTLEEGDYMLVSGARMAKGNVLAALRSFHVEAGKTTSVPLVIRENKDDVDVIGSIDAEAKFNLINGESTSILSTTGRGYFIIGILGPRQEPTNHALKDIAAVAQQFNTWNRSMILLFKDEQSYQKYDAGEFGTLPATITYGIDTHETITKMIAGAVNLPNSTSLPIFVIADTFGRVVFVSQGYTIGLGEQMLNVIEKI